MPTPVRSVKNQYRGINAHLHSYWQNAGGWAEFHANHIPDLMRRLRARLLPMGYTATIEPSLHIRREDDSTEKPQSDVTIYDLDPIRPLQKPVPLTGSAGELVLPAPVVLGLSEIAEKPFRAIGIYPSPPRGSARGEPVAWLELLSPSSKPGGQDNDEYVGKRLKILRAGMVFIELDYLHESAPTLTYIASYRTRGKEQPGEPDAHPYRILIIDPRPDLMEAPAHIYEFDVDQPIPKVTIPLNVGDTLEFDFDEAYQKTHDETLDAEELVDYRDFPLHFDRYSEDDQRRIAVRMVAALEAARRKLDLETAPFPVESLSLSEALARLETLNADG